MLEFIWGALSDGYFWLGRLPGAAVGAWAIMQNSDYRQFQAAEQQKERDALFKKYTDYN